MSSVNGQYKGNKTFMLAWILFRQNEIQSGKQFDLGENSIIMNSACREHRLLYNTPQEPPSQTRSYATWYLKKAGLVIQIASSNPIYQLTPKGVQWKNNIANMMHLFFKEIGEIQKECSRKSKEKKSKQMFGNLQVTQQPNFFQPTLPAVTLPAASMKIISCHTSKCVIYLPENETTIEKLALLATGML